MGAPLRMLDAVFTIGDEGAIAGLGGLVQARVTR